MEVFYGIEGRYINVTYLCYLKCVKNGILTIPQGDESRTNIFGDSLFGILKHIRINNTIYRFDQTVRLEVPEISQESISNMRKNWWNTIGKNIVAPEQRLKSLHSYIYLHHGSKTDEYPEQLMAIKYIKETDTVLEIGGNIGRNSCVIGSILNDDRNLVTLECCETYANQLRENRDNNFFNFNIEVSALSKVPLIQKGWNTIVNENVNNIPQGFTKVNTITFSELQEKYNLTFNVLVADCEGALYQILKDEPDLLKNIKTIIIENDFTQIHPKQYVDEVFLKNGFHPVYTEAGGWGVCYSFFYEVFQK